MGQGTILFWTRGSTWFRERAGRVLPIVYLLMSGLAVQAADVPVSDGQGRKGLGVPAAVSRFDEWAEAWRARGGGQGVNFEAEGLRLVEGRRAAFRQMIREDPRAALAAAVRGPSRSALPAAVRDRLEQTVSGRGFLGVLCTLQSSHGVHDHGAAQISRYVVLSGRKYEAHVYGQRLNLMTRESVWLQGVAVDGVLAVAEDPVRRLEEEELAALGTGRDEPRECETCRQPLVQDGPGVWGELGGRTLRVCSEDHWVVLNQQILADDEDGAPIADGPLADSAWTEGAKRVLLIRVDFDDLPGEPVSETAAMALLDDRAAPFFEENSYGKTTLSGTVTPVFRMPESSTYYVDNDADVELLNDARAVARAGGYDPALYDLDIAGFKTIFSGWAGRGYVGGKGLWINGYFDDRVTFHELGHNYGLWHANAWNATDDTVIGEGTAEEYGDTFETMGRSGGATLHFGSWYKSLLGWLTPDESTTVADSGTYRVFAHDMAVGTGLNRYLRIPNPRDASHDYCVEFRQKITSNRWLMNGVKLTWVLQNNSSVGSRLLDTTPGTADDRNDHAVVVGRTFSDVAAGIHITPVGKAGTVPEAVDVVVNLGVFPDNESPALALNASAVQVALNSAVNFTAAAADPDGDELAYAWDYGDRNFGPNSAEVSKSWSSTGQYVVRCEVSDMKGGTCSRALLVTVGAPNASVVRGEVRDENGAPVSGVRIFNGLGVKDSRYRTSWTDSSGGYALVNLVTGTYTLAALRPGYDLMVSNFANPVTVAPDFVGADFAAAAVGATLSGRVTDEGLGVAGVVVADGARSVLTDANGDYVINDVPWGTVLLTAQKSGYAFITSGFSNPAVVEGNDLSGLDFIHFVPTYTLSGEITDVTDNTSLQVTDGYRQTTARKIGRRASFTLDGVPAGIWHLRVLSANASYTPDNFSNPLVVEADRSGLAFARQSSRTFAISGTILDDGVGVAGVQVDVGNTSGVTDSRGSFYASDLVDGEHVVSPQDAVIAFEPASRTVTVAGVDMTGVDFTVLTTAPPVLNIAVSKESFLEGDSDPPVATVTRSGDAGGELTVQLEIGGTAAAGYDYDLLPDSVTLHAGETQVAWPVVVVDDDSPECDESLIIAIAATEGYTVGTAASVTLGFIDNDLPAIDLLAGTAFWSEDSDLPVEVTVVRSGCLSKELVVDLRWFGTAESGVDYEGATEDVRFSAGEDLVAVPVRAVVDQHVEGMETLGVEVVPGTGYLPGALSRVDGWLRDAAVDEWRLAVFGQEAGILEIAGDLANPDGDPFSNLAEFVYGLDPLTPEANGGPQVALESGSTVLTFRRRIDLGRVNMAVERTDDLLGVWSSATDPEITAEDADFEWMRWVEPDPVARSRYFRVQVSR